MEPGAEVLSNPSIFSMIFGSGPVVQLVLLILVVLSIWSWALTIAKALQLGKAKAQSKEFSAIFWETRNLGRIDDSAKRLDSSPLTQVFLCGYRELTHVLQESSRAKGNAARGDLSTIERVLRRAEFEEAVKLDKGNTFLATVASSAPFIGLFGTVWGIMNAFHNLSGGSSTTLQAVAPGISEALVATAIGLAAAIPAAVAYNYFSATVKEFRESMDKFSLEFIELARQYF